jgi:hypothetical protein
MLSTMLAVCLVGANGKWITEVEVLERINGVLKPVDDAMLVMLRRAAPAPEGKSFVSLQHDSKRKGFYVTDEIPQDTTDVSILIQKPSRDPKFKNYPAKDDPPGAIPYKARITRVIQVNGHAANEPAHPRDPIAWRDYSEPIVVCCCTPCGCVSTVVGYRMRRMPVYGPDDQDQASTPNRTSTAESANLDIAGEPLFKSRCSLDTVPPPETPPVRIVARIRLIALPSVARREPEPIPLPSRIRIPFADDSPARPLNVASD